MRAVAVGTTRLVVRLRLVPVEDGSTAPGRLRHLPRQAGELEAEADLAQHPAEAAGGACVQRMLELVDEAFPDVVQPLLQRCLAPLLAEGDQLGIVPVLGDLSLDLLDRDAQGRRDVEERRATGDDPRGAGPGERGG